MGVMSKGSLIRKQVVLTGGDLVAALVILFVWLAGPGKEGGQVLIDFRLLAFVPILMLSSYLCEVYDPETRHLMQTARRSLCALAISFVLLILVGRFSLMPWRVILGLLCYPVFQMLWQSFYHSLDGSSLLTRKIVVVGTGMAAEQVEHLISQGSGKYSLCGYVSTPADPLEVPADKIIGSVDDIVEICRQQQVYGIILALTERRGALSVQKLLSCKLMGVRIIDYPNFYETMTGKIPVEHINPSWLVQSSGFLVTPVMRGGKRVFDIFMSLLLLLFVLPFSPFIIYLVKYRSPGPVIYSQQRVGEFNENFTIYKFRTMVPNAESMTGASFAQEDDPRISHFGRMLRKTRIDELPQLWNVLKGDMSFVGPRPERPEFVKQICEATPYYLERHAVKPGITGWAQVMFPYGSSLGDSIEKLRYDLYYINHLSIFLEIMIIFRTIKVVLFRKGGR